MKLIWPLLFAVSLASCASPVAPSAAQKGMKMAADQYDPNGGTDISNGGATPDWWVTNQPTNPQPAQPGQFIPGNTFTNTSPTPASRPSGIPDPANPGYDTNGYILNSTFDPNAGPFGHVTPNGSGPTTPTPDPSPGAQTWGGPVAPFSGEPYPTFTPPPLPDALKNPWTLPTAESLLSTPGYLSRYQQGLDSRQKSAAAHGTILNGGTQKALDRYGSDYAQQGYQQDVDNSLQQRQQASNDYLNLAYGPAWQSNQAAVNQYGQLYRQYSDSVANGRNSQNDYWNQQMQLLNAGLDAARSGSPGSTGGQG